MEWLEYLGRYGSLEELVVKNCNEIRQYDLLKFGPGWVKLQKFEFEMNGKYRCTPPHDPSYPHSYDISCENLKELRLARIVTAQVFGLRFLLGKCKALEKLWLEFVVGLNENELIKIFQNCSNLKSISIWRCSFQFGTALTNNTFKALALSCPMLQVLEISCRIGYTQKGIVALVQSCPIRDLVLNGGSIFRDEGVEGLSCSRFLERLHLVCCSSITDAAMNFIIESPCLSNLTLSRCDNVTDDGMAVLVRSQKLESLTVICCRQISQDGVQGAAKSVRYTAEIESPTRQSGMNINCSRRNKLRSAFKVIFGCY